MAETDASVVCLTITGSDGFFVFVFIAGKVNGSFGCLDYNKMYVMLFEVRSAGAQRRF